MTNEIWKPVPGTKGFYSVSSLGRVRSEARTLHYSNGRVIFWKEKILKPVRLVSGYHKVTLHVDKKTKQRNVHCLVLEAFVGPRPQGMEGCHNNGNPSDSRLTNLRWDTPKANCADAAKHGTAHFKKGMQGRKAPRMVGRKLTDDQVREIRSVYNKRNGSELAAKYGVHKKYVEQIAHGIGRPYV